MLLSHRHLRPSFFTIWRMKSLHGKNGNFKVPVITLQPQYALIFLLIFIYTDCKSQSSIPNSRFSICAAYTFSSLSDEGTLIDAEDMAIPYGLRSLLKYKLSDTWSIEGGMQGRAKNKWSGSILLNDDVTLIPYTYSAWYLDLPLIATLHAFGTKRFHFNILLGIQQTWLFYNVDYAASFGWPSHYSEVYPGTAGILGFGESYAITSRIRIEAEQTPTYYFMGELKGTNGPELKIGIEYIL